MAGNQPFHVMVKPAGAACNYDCAYCFYLRKAALYPNTRTRMSDATLQAYTRQMFAAQPGAREVTFAWQGGEPTLMGLDFFRRAVALQKQYAPPGTTVHNAFQTNGALLDEEWCAFLREERFLIGLSIDGAREHHDTYRRDRGGAPTFDRTFAAIQRLRQAGVDFNTLTCVNANNAAHGRDVYRFLRDECGSRFHQYIPIVEREDGSRVSARSVRGADYGRFLIDVFDEWLRRDVGTVYVQMFDTALAAWLGQPSPLCVYAETCGHALAMEFNGDLYACDHFVEPRFRLGNLHDAPLVDLVALPKQRRFGLNKRDSLPRACRECRVRFACNGGCPKDRLLRAPSGEPLETAPLNALCAGYYAFFTYVDPVMRRMADLLRQERAPASVMTEWAARPPLRDLPDDAPCPCGSDLPVAECHRKPVSRRRHGGAAQG